MKPLNLSGKILLIPMNSLSEATRAAIRMEDGMQAAFGTNIFVYATGRVHSCCCGGHGHHHQHEEEHECCGGHGHHHQHEEEHECCGGHGHHHQHEEGHECCGGHGHHHQHEEEHECCGGHGHHHQHEEEHECCGGHGHCQEEKYDATQADETYFDSEDLAYGKDEPITEIIDGNLLLVVNEPVVLVNVPDAQHIGFDLSLAKDFDLPPDGVTLVPGRDVDKEGFQTGPISIQIKD